MGYRSLIKVGDWDSVTLNGVAENRTHSAAHQLQTVGAQAITHDVKGNMTATHDGQSFSWDIDNHLQTVTVPPGVQGTGKVNVHAGNPLRAQIASGPRSPVRIRMQSSIGRTKIFPSPISPVSPVRPPWMMALMVGSTKSSFTAI